MDLSTTLRAARERRSLSLNQLATVTKIPLRVLQALEQGAFEKVPPGIFIRGYLRAYAREVGLNPEEVVQQFLMETDAVPADLPPVPQPAPVEEIEETRFDPDVSESGPGWGYVLIVAALLLGVISFNRSNPSTDAPALAVSPLAEAPAPAAAPVQPVTASLDRLEAVATSGETRRFELAAQGPCWVEAVVDGRKIVYRLMQPGERQSIDVEREIVLRVGDPGAFTYSVNGMPGQSLGKAGIPITVRFSGAGQPEPLAASL